MKRLLVATPAYDYIPKIIGVTVQDDACCVALFMRMSNTALSSLLNAACQIKEHILNPVACIEREEI